MEGVTAVLLAVLADTHLSSRSQRSLPAAARRLLGVADLILHAGDITDAALLEDLATYAPVHAVLGNNDEGLSLPETIELELGGVALAMIHDSGTRAGRERRMHRRFPDAAVVVFGHSHIPWNAEGADGQLLFNPGSPTQRRRQPHPTMGLLELSDGRVARHDIVRVDS